MPLFKRDKSVAPAPAAAPQPQVPQGNLPCSRTGCARPDGLQCQYIDRRGHTCTSVFCPDHNRVIMSHVYCPRHAGIMTALLASPKKGHLPDIDNRAPSLANWIGNDIDARVRQILQSMRHGEESVIIEPVGYVYSVHDKSHRWERAWKLADHTGITVKVSVDVDEGNDAVVRLRVGQRDVSRFVPPWVEHHRKREWISPEQDMQERTSFYNEMCDVIRETVGAYRESQGLLPYIGAEGSPGSGSGAS